ncbi:uncharacterized protein MONOS_939 [Monocercomonoides exilis]|uniref:uncharacterized protein n=1 Tax=Monocercomonoides exilis TaxID=2049356 RepID=UPI00355A3EBD|nr:hypothetical protein MONOS_939 [Monocercomonoides exilis]|eukprot:MONOS_939.1-p1 / transcript=MONOS_939.1 / gene=MONOS_939 / organism=Monocercomonoides_exilis_PA203 / gene_product=unspecified product / transcript_product=unspecified product / location=Mono_scaffold00015:217656-217907(-) / protein_length=84 / sequence_SO=supercontig / SO=protein_coding / is_pseudo=false
MRIKKKKEKKRLKIIIQFVVFCTMVRSPMFNYATWEDYMTSVGYTGPDDKNMWKITVNPTKTQLVNMNEFWAQANASVKKLSP